ncbi:MAG: sugar phosphate isomerase/epimerase family protein, partial [Armatimonadota bacterium]
MQVSISTGCLHHLPPDQIADAAVAAGFQNVEVLLNGGLMQNIEAMRSALCSRRLTVSAVHAPFYLDWLLSAPRKQEEAVSAASAVVEAAAQLKAPILTIHPGKSPPLGIPAREYIETAASNLNSICKAAAEQGIELLLENTAGLYFLGIKIAGQLASSPEEMERFLGPPNSPRMRMTFDTSHAFTIKSTTVDGYIYRMNSRIASVHLSDTNGLTDHLPIGYGKLDFHRIFSALRNVGFNGNVTLEFRPSLSSLEELRRNRILVET